MKGLPRSITVCRTRWPVTFNGKSEVNDATCYNDPRERPKRIVFHRDVLGDDALLMEAVIHEMLHAAAWPIEEAFIDMYSHDVARTLARFGFKRG